MSGPKYSFVSPIHDEEGSLSELHRRLAALMDTLDGDSEMILVDDGSRDASYPIMLDLNRTDPRVKVVRLSRNFGHQLAISAGIDFAAGDAVIVMDGDLQHPPEVVPEFIERWQDGYEIVYGVRRESAEGWMKRDGRTRPLRAARHDSATSTCPRQRATSAFSIARAVEALKAMREHNRYVRGMVSWVGFNQIGVPYDVPPRFAGKSKYTPRRLMGLAGAGITSLSNVPLKLALRVGYVVAALSIAFGISAVIAKLANLFDVPGWTSIVVVTSFVGGVQLILIGVLGEYLALVYDEVKVAAAVPRPEPARLRRGARARHRRRDREPRMTTSAAPASRTAARAWSARRTHAGLLAYGVVLALVAMSLWSSAIPTSQVRLEGFRQNLLANSLSVLDQGGPPLLASSVPYQQGLKHPSSFYPANQGDDQGIYLYLPVAGHALGDSNPLSLEKWFAVGCMALIPLLYPLLFFVLFDSLAAALIVPLVAVSALKGIINTDINWMTAWILLLGLPLVYVAARRRDRPWLSLGLLVGAAVLASFATSVRDQRGARRGARRVRRCGRIRARLAAADRRRSSRRRRVSLDRQVHVRGRPRLSRPRLAHGGVDAAERRIRSGMRRTSASVTCPNRWGIRWDDTFGLQAAQKVDPKVVFLSPHYEQILRHLYFSAIRQDPGWAAHLYLVKLAVLVRTGAHHYWLALIVLPVLLAIGPAARRLRFQMLLLVPCLLVTIIPPLLTQPVTYDAGFLGGLALVSFLVLGALFLDAEPLTRRISSASLGKLFDGQPANATIAQARSLLRTGAEKAKRTRVSVVVGVAVVGSIVLAVAAAFAASALASANDDTAFFQAKATPVAALPGGAHTVASWTSSFPGWTAANGATSTPTAAGAQIQTADALAVPQFESPPVRLPAGDYAFVVSGAVDKGGILANVLQQDTGTSLGAGFYWHGQSGLDRPGMVSKFKLTKPTSVQLALEDWARTIVPSKWTVRNVRLVRLPPAG